MFNFNSSPFVNEALVAMRQLQQRHRIVVYIPSESECTASGCGHDSFTNSKKRIDCTTCDARGYITTWTIRHLVGRVIQPDPLTFDFRNEFAIAETADLVIFVDKNEQETIERIRQEERAYFDIDGIKYRPTSMTPIGVAGYHELRVECSTYKSR